MIRMEIACFLTIAFMAMIYFSAEREKTRIHKIFTSLLIVSMLHLTFDGLTVYTVNHLGTVPAWLNEVLHRLYIGTMILVFFLLYRYIIQLIEEEMKTHIHLLGIGTFTWIVVFLGTIFLPIEYVETPQGNYSYGPVAFLTYISIVIYLALTIFALHRHWMHIQYKKKMIISFAIGIEIIVGVYQAIRPLSLISGMGIMLVNLSIYLTMENPDIVLVKQIQEEKRKADEANAAKSTFLSHMSHEIRTPMNAIVGMTEIMLRTDLSEEQKEYLTNIKSSGNALVSIINDILDISKIEAGKMELVEDVYEIRSMLNEIYMLIQNRIEDKPVELLCEVDDEMPCRLYGDGLRIRQIFINLLNNAVKFTEEGHVKLKVNIESKTENEIMLFVSVSDTGQGIKEEDMKRLFGAFEQVNTKKNIGKEGTGLGLAISSELIHLMGGRLEVRSEYGKGSEFFFTIRQQLVSGEIGEQEDAEPESMNFVAPDAKLLIVDDNEMNCKVAAGLLTPLKVQIDIAENGKKALSMIKQKEYHMIFMDHMMPIMDGVETTKRLRSEKDTYSREVPVIALTANVMKGMEKLFEEAGMNGFLAKPIDVRQMYAIIRKWLPESLIVKQADDEYGEYGMQNGMLSDTKELPVIEGLDIKEGIKNCGNREFFVSLLGDFYKLIELKAVKVENCVKDNQIRDYTIEVHALKSTARMIGAMELSKQFEYLEQLGNSADVEVIKKETPEVLAFYRSYKTILESYGAVQEKDKRETTVEEIITYLRNIQEAMEEFALDAMDEAMEELEKCQLPEECQKWMESLRGFVVDVAMEEVQDTTEKMIQVLEKRVSDGMKKSISNIG